MLGSESEWRPKARSVPSCFLLNLTKGASPNKNVQAGARVFDWGRAGAKHPNFRKFSVSAPSAPVVFGAMPPPHVRPCWRYHRLHICDFSQILAYNCILKGLLRVLRPHLSSFIPFKISKWVLGQIWDISLCKRSEVCAVLIVLIDSPFLNQGPIDRCYVWANFLS